MMETTTVFYQAEELVGVELIEVERDATLASVLETLGKKHGWSEELLLFVEDGDEPVNGTLLVRDIEIAIGTKLHAHRCHRIEVSVSYNNTSVTYEYAPSATIARIEHHAAVKGFRLSEEAAAEHVLQIKGMTVQPSTGTHVGSLVRHPDCHIAFDLVPKVRVQGSWSRPC